MIKKKPSRKTTPIMSTSFAIQTAMSTNELESLMHQLHHEAKERALDVERPAGPGFSQYPYPIEKLKVRRVWLTVTFNEEPPCVREEDTVKPTTRAGKKGARR